MNIKLIKTENVNFYIKFEFLKLCGCGIRGKCKYKMFGKCFAIVLRNEFREDCACVINEEFVTKMRAEKELWKKEWDEKISANFA